MRRFLVVLAAVLAVASIPSAAGALTFRIVRTPPELPGWETPNAPGSITTPRPLSRAPVQPAVRSYEELLSLWQDAGSAYGVPWTVLGAINKIESNFGQNMGPSSAGAVGWMQFMPSTWARWGLDADGNGIADPWNPEDAVYAAARYLAAADGQTDIERAVFAYNHAQWYVDDVMSTAALFSDGSPEFSMSQLASRPDFGEQIAKARAHIDRTKRAASSAENRLEGFEPVHLRLERRAGNPRLSDAEFLRAEQRLDRVEARIEQTRERLAHLYAAVDDAVSDLGDLRDQQAAVSLSSVFAPVSSSGNYVFPVGGGPSVVFVGHTHHDYPAADIAAPEGTPLFALADSVVTDAWPEGNGKCGIGFTLRTDGGVEFVYCHLSYLDETVVRGAALAAGAPVGLVGATGDATGPHLHLAFVPALSYPQNEPWFESFAGVAFTWKDAPTPNRTRALAHRAKASAPRIFRIVRSTGRVIHFTR